MPRFTPAALVLVAIAGCSAKSQSFPPGAAEDAGSRAGEVAAQSAPRKAYLAASTPGERLELVTPPGGGLVLGTPLFLYEATDEGALVRIGDVASYATFLPADDDDLTGYDVPARMHPMGIVGPPSQLTFLTATGARRWDGKTWAPVPKPDAYETEVIPWGDIDRPDNVSIHNVKRLADGRILAVGDFDGARATMIVPAGRRSGPIVRIGQDVDWCTVPRAFDGNVWLFCTPRWRSNEKPMLFKLAGDRWDVVTVPGDSSFKHAPSIADDGAIWTAEGAEVQRILPDGKVERFAPPDADPSLVRPTFYSYPSATVAKEGAQLRTWMETRLRTDVVVGAMRDVEEIVPRPGGRAWVRMRGDHSVAHLVWIGPKAPSARIAVGSEVDQRNEVRNTRPLRTWVGHCPQLFVSLGERAWKSEADIKKIVGHASDHSAIVEGRLGGKRAVGVLLWRPDPDIKEADLERTANALVQRFTDNPVTPPEVTCTVPVLERAQPISL